MARPENEPRRLASGIRLATRDGKHVVDVIAGERTIKRISLAPFERDAFRADLIGCAWRPDGDAA